MRLNHDDEHAMARRYDAFVCKLGTIRSLKPLYWCSLIRTVPFQDMEVAMDLILEDLQDSRSQA